ncbi:MAG: helix-turn-helix transcriptional regulator [Bacillota bacterium]
MSGFLAPHARFWTVSFGGLYPALSVLEAGDIEIHAKSGSSKTYAITDQGRRKFD